MSAAKDKSAFLEAHGLTAVVESGSLRRISFGGREVIRLIDTPIRDADWGTLPTETLRMEMKPKAGFHHEFRTKNGSIEGCLTVSVVVSGQTTQLIADLVLTALRECVVNRAGFVVLHPLDGVVGAPLDVVSPDGTTYQTRFPKQISAAQPVMNISALSHNVGDVRVSLVFEGEIFEMEDQRNWTDASFKTYCRPLSLPRPYTLAEGAQVRQRITATLAGVTQSARIPASAAQSQSAVMPEICLAHEADLTGAPHQLLSTIAPQELQLRLHGDMTVPADLPDLPMTVELVLEGDDPEAAIRQAQVNLARAGIAAHRVIALPQPYLNSHQPQGPWPEGPTPMDLIPLLRRAFPEAQIGGGMLTNFTEFNRCPPDPALIDFASFGTTAIVHAADDLSVVESLEALPDVIASAQVLGGVRALRLGLMSIAMRSNPYGSGVVPNPNGARLPMAMVDPRQSDEFAAAFAFGIAAACARGGVASFAPAMTSGPLGMADQQRFWPLWHATSALAALAGTPVDIKGSPASGLVVIRGRGRRGVAGLAANLGATDVRIDGPALRITSRKSPDWIDTAGQGSDVILPPMTAALLTGSVP